MKPRNNIKTHILLMAAVAAVAAVSCTKSEPTLVEQPQPRTIQIRAALPQPATTRTLFEGATWNNTNGYGFSKIKWKAGDKISILCWQEGESWGKRISKKNSLGWIVEDNGEIIHSLQASEISSDGTKMNFSFDLPSDIDNAKDIYVMLTYLGKSEYMPPRTDLPEGYKNKPWLCFQFPKISEADDRKDFAYIANAVPMILRYTIPKGPGSGDTQPLIDGTFKHICTLFAVDIKNETSASITPDVIQIEYKTGNAIDSGYPYYDPVNDHIIESISTRKKTKVDIYNHKDIKPGERFVYFLSTIIDKTAPLNDLTVVYKDKNASYIRTKTSKTSTKTLERGKCYTLNVKVTDISSYGEGLIWETTIPGSAAPME